MEEIINIINQIRNTSSSNDKISILKANKNNETLCKILKYTYDTNKQYGFSEKKLRELLQLNKSSESTWNDCFEMFDTLCTSNINDTLRQNVINFMFDKSELEKDLLIKVLTKDLRCKISAKIINKAIPNCIFIWGIQGGVPLKGHDFKDNTWFALSRKMNGVHGTFYNDNFKSRQNKDMFGYEHIKQDIYKLQENFSQWNDYVFEGELQRKNINDVSDEENFRLSCSIINSNKEEKTEIQFVLFDLLPKDEFEYGESRLKYKDRKNQMELIREQIKLLNLTNLDVIPFYYEGTDKSKIKYYLDNVDKLGYEGLMCAKNVTYKNKKHTGLLKVKTFLEGDFKIIGYKESEKNANTLGSIIIEYKGNSVGVNGIKDSIKEELWKNKDKYLGTIVTLKYKTESKDSKTGLPSLQFASLLKLRPDKTEPNYD